jgi:hypothetical protein
MCTCYIHRGLPYAYRARQCVKVFVPIGTVSGKYKESSLIFFWDLIRKVGILSVLHARHSILYMYVLSLLPQQHILQFEQLDMACARETTLRDRSRGECPDDADLSMARRPSGGRKRMAEQLSVDAVTSIGRHNHGIIGMQWVPGDNWLFQSRNWSRVYKCE